MAAKKKKPPKKKSPPRPAEGRVNPFLQVRPKGRKPRPKRRK
jgi:hypothetical protein